MSDYSSECGIILPDGSFYPCSYGQHGSTCEQIINEHGTESVKGSILLLGHGGVVIEDPDNKFVDYFFTAEQIAVLKEIVSGDASHENLLDGAETALALSDGALDMGTSRYRQLPKRKKSPMNAPMTFAEAFAIAHGVKIARLDGSADEQLKALIKMEPTPQP